MNLFYAVHSSWKACIVQLYYWGPFDDGLVTLATLVSSPWVRLAFLMPDIKQGFL
jgi:hypothetical protein